MKRPYLSVVIPCFNEEQNIRLGTLDKVARYMDKQKYTWEVLIVDDGSTDGSLSLLKKFIANNKNFSIVENIHMGKAGTVVTGMLKARGDYVLFSDLDQSTPLDQVEKLLPFFNQDFDIVIGSRSNRRSGAPLFRRLMGPGFMFVRNFILGLGSIEDTQCGFKAFKRDVAHDVFSRLVLYKEEIEISGPRVKAGFDVEFLYIAHKLGYKIKEVPVEWHYVDTRRVSPIMDSLDALKDIVQIRLNSMRGVYNE